MALTKEERRFRIKKRIRKVVKGTTERPRLVVFRSNKETYAQIVDDTTKKTLTSVSSREKNILAAKGTKTEKAKFVGKLIAEKASEIGIKNVVFDRNGFLYHGRIKAVADAARENGLKI
ncbi:MAG: 50S ribosomal protein L18 [Bacteroidales bacterium]|jgi:large subunit ribosomal protein L18